LSDGAGVQLQWNSLSHEEERIGKIVDRKRIREYYYAA
jgi:hypothetical protein